MKAIAPPHRARTVLRAPGIVPLSIGLIWALLFAWVGGEVVRWSFHAFPLLLLLLLSALGLYVVPGLALLRWLWPDLSLPWTERLALACGVGVALPPFLLEAAHLVGLPWTTWTTVAYVGLAFALVVVRPSWGAAGSLRRPLALSWHGAMLAGLVAIALLVRLYLVRDLPVGMWGDSYHHTMIAQLLVDNRGLFSSWEPYAPLVTFTYHYGFHANVAFFHWLTGIAVPQSVLLVGQLLSVASILSAYVLASHLAGNRHAGIWAAALTGFVNTQPIYFVNWGRYTQLAGQVLLPVVLICWIASLERARRSWRLGILTALMTACLMLTHYVVTIFAALFLLVYVVVRVAREPRWPVIQLTLSRAATMAGLALLLAGPWLVNTVEGNLDRIVGAFLDKSVGTQLIAGNSSLQPITPLYLTGSILLLATIGVIVALARRDWRMLLPAVWSQILVLLVVPQVVGLPGAGVVNWLTAYIALYLTAIPLAAYPLGLGQAALRAWHARLGYALATALLVMASIWGSRWQQHLLNPAHQLFTPSDNRAMQWIRTHTPASADFLVNMFPAYGDTTTVGSDGGWWIPLLTGRDTTLPPITYGSEQTAQPDYVRRVNAFAAAIRSHPPATEDGITLLREAGIDYVYNGARSGKDQAGQEVRFDIAALRRHPAFRVVYEQDGVHIFALQP